MADFIERLKSGVLVADGAMGTMLQQAGLLPGSAPEEWNISHPKVIEGVHTAYIQAGAGLILTNTFGGNSIKLKKSGLEGKTAEVNIQAACIAKKAAAGAVDFSGNKVYVAGDIGPSGEFMEPLGALKRDDLIDAFSRQAEYLAEGGVDLFIIETMTDIEELVCAVEAVNKVSQLPVIASMSFEPAGDKYRTMMGVGPQAMFDRLVSMDCRIMGANCGLIPDQMKEVIRDLKSCRQKDSAKIKKDTAAVQQDAVEGGRKFFFIAQPNAGHPKLVDGKTVFEQTPNEFAHQASQLVAAGADIIGGCCGTTPSHIEKLCEAIKTL